MAVIYNIIHRVLTPIVSHEVESHADIFKKWLLFLQDRCCCKELVSGVKAYGKCSTPSLFHTLQLHHQGKPSFLRKIGLGRKNDFL